eukprot:scaffold14529_cov60-Phaeocystis_antarctica.AAC.7
MDCSTEFDHGGAYIVPFHPNSPSPQHVSSSHMGLSVPHTQHGVLHAHLPPSRSPQLEASRGSDCVEDLLAISNPGWTPRLCGDRPCS